MRDGRAVGASDSVKPAERECAPRFAAKCYNTAMKRKLAVGHFFNAPFQAACAAHVPHIREVFFAWPGVLSCRPAPEFTPAVRDRLLDDLRWARRNGIELDTLFNCNCYGERAISPELADFVCRVLREMDGEGLFPETVTTTSPFVATVLRRCFPSVKIRWSVNLRVHGSVGFESVEELFDSFYVSRECQRDIRYLAELSQWAKAHGKVMGLQANSGCIRQCPFQQFHDNLHGHGDGRRPEDVATAKDYGFSFFRCKTNYERGRFEDFLRATWLRPEDMPRYEPYVGIVKLATRRHPDPVKVLNAYATCAYEGNLADLMDPAHAFPGSFENGRFNAAAGLWEAVRDCPRADNCNHCGQCAALMKEVFL